MVTYLIVRTVRRVANRLFVLSNQHSSLIESILTGLGLFGLASTGMCLAALARSHHEDSKCGLAAGR